MTYARAQLAWVLDMGSKPWMEQSARDPFSFSRGKNGAKKKKKISLRCLNICNSERDFPKCQSFHVLLRGNPNRNYSFIAAQFLSLILSRLTAVNIEKSLCRFILAGWLLNNHSADVITNRLLCILN
jgi:hypothetical protein